MKREKTLDYVEFFAPDLAVIKKFYGAVFDWKFTDFGPEYTDFFDGVRHGGFAKGEVKTGSTLVVLYSDELEKIQKKNNDARRKNFRRNFYISRRTTVSIY